MAMTTAADRLIVALDVSNARAVHLISEIVSRSDVRFFKIGLRNFLQNDNYGVISSVTALARIINDPLPGAHPELKSGLFVDLKMFDTRDTIEGAVKYAFEDLGARFVAVHATPSVMESAARSTPPPTRSPQRGRSSRRWRR